MAQDAFPEMWAGFSWLFLGVSRVVFLLAFGFPPVAGGIVIAFVDDL